STDTLFPEYNDRGASFSLWFRPDNLTPEVKQGILNHDVGTSWVALWVEPEGIGGSASNFGDHFIGLAEETGNVTGGWHHIVGVLADTADNFTDADTFLLYYDGQLRSATLTQDSAPTVEPGPWTIGSGVTRLTYLPFVGDLDDIRFYNRALSPEEVRILFEHSD
ncbi:MAG: LamG domain-containing protein, partial [Myxococcota bacterium]